MCEEGGTGEVAGEDGRDGERENGNGAGEEEGNSKSKSLDLEGGKEEEQDEEVGGAQTSRGWARDGMCCHSASERESGFRPVSTGAAADDSSIKSTSISSLAKLLLPVSRSFLFPFSRLFLAIGNSIVGASRTVSFNPLQGAGSTLLYVPCQPHPNLSSKQQTHHFPTPPGPPLTHLPQPPPSLRSPNHSPPHPFDPPLLPQHTPHQRSPLNLHPPLQ